MPTTDNSAKAREAWEHIEIKKLIEDQQGIYKEHPHRTDTQVQFAKKDFLPRLAAASFGKPDLRHIPFFHLRFILLRLGSGYSDHAEPSKVAVDTDYFSEKTLLSIFGSFHAFILEHRAWEAEDGSWQARAFRRAVVFATYYLQSLNVVDAYLEGGSFKETLKYINAIKKKRAPFECAMRYLCETIRSSFHSFVDLTLLLCLGSDVTDEERKAIASVPKGAWNEKIFERALSLRRNGNRGSR